jgi:K+-transporting ATPase c subunit
MSVGVSPNHSPRAHHLHQQQRGDGYFPAPAEETNSRRNSLVYDPIRSSANNTADTTPLIKRIIQQDTNFQRRHSIANLETRSSSFSSNPIHGNTVISIYK